MIRQDWSSLKKLLFFQMAAGGGTAVEATATGNPLTFLTDLARPLKSLLIPFTPVQSGTGDPSPQNIRSILPWNGLKVWQTGKNLLNPVWWDNISDNKSYVRYDNGTLVYQAISYKASDYVSVMGNTEYTLHAVMRGQSASGIAFYDSSKQYISGIQINSSTKTDHTFTTPSNAVYMRFWDDSGVMPWNEVMLVYGSTAPTSYEPYQPITETDISFPSPVYGGTLDVVSGVLTVEYVGGVFKWSQGTNEAVYENVKRRRFVINGSGDVPTGSAYSICNIAKYNANISLDEPHFYKVSGANAYYVYLPINTDENTEISICGELTTPQEITLTPEQITAIKGNNTIWSDANGNMTATYLKKG